MTGHEEEQAEEPRDVRLLQAVHDKYGELLAGVTVDDMVSELLSPLQTSGDIPTPPKTVKTDRQTNIVEQIRNDSLKVMEIIGKSCKDNSSKKKIDLNFEEVYAYIEAHYKKSNRVQLVVEEFLEMHGIDENRNRSRSSSPEIIEVKVDQIKSKGKGVGKKSKRAAPDQDDVSSQTSKEIKLSGAPAIDPMTQNLADSLSGMFPSTPKKYILSRVSELVGKDAELNNLIEELLLDPNPPPDWKDLTQSVEEPEVVIIDDEKP